MIPCVGHKKHTSTTSATKKLLNRFPPNNTTSPHKTNKQLQNSTFVARVFFGWERSHHPSPLQKNVVLKHPRPLHWFHCSSIPRVKTDVTNVEKPTCKNVRKLWLHQELKKAPKNEGTETCKIYKAILDSRGGFSRIHKPKNIQLTKVRIPPF